MDDKLWSGIVFCTVIAIGIAAFIAFVAYFIGSTDGYRDGRNEMEIEALAHGYAEWVLPEDPNDKPVWQWIEREGEDER